MGDRFQCWCPDVGHDGPDDGSTVRAFDAAAAAEDYIEERYCAWDYPQNATVHVRDADGRESVFVIYVDHEPVFRAKDVTP